MAEPIRWPFTVRERLGDDGVAALLAAQREWKEEVLTTATDRYERRLVEEASRIRADVAETRADLHAEVAQTRAELAQTRAELRAELRAESAATRADILRWSFGFWVGQLVSVGGLLALFRFR